MAPTGLLYSTPEGSFTPDAVARCMLCRFRRNVTEHAARRKDNGTAQIMHVDKYTYTSGYATWFTAGGAIRIGHYDVIDDVITQKL